VAKVPIPNWNPDGVLPPINAAFPVSPDRSPYHVSLEDIVDRFGTSNERTQILNGFMRFREELFLVGLQKGFQWLDGSFMENSEFLAGRPPNDIDVVTFYWLPTGATQATVLASKPELFDARQTKTDYSVDGYFVELSTSAPETVVKEAAYWYGVWSHRRNDKWKGYLQVDLDQSETVLAKARMAKLAAPEGVP
jgi:hypothetical protein